MKHGKTLLNRACNLVVVRGAGDIGTGVIHKLIRSGFRVLALEIEKPTAIRTAVAFSSAVYSGNVEIESIKGIRTESVAEAKSIMARGQAAVMVDPSASLVKEIDPFAVVDAILAKMNLGTDRSMAPVVIGLGPGFCAGNDVHAVVETNRGHYLGKLILEGSAAEDTGIPGTISEKTGERVLRSPAGGIFKPLTSIGDLVSEGDAVALVGPLPVVTRLSGVVRGLLPGGIEVSEGFKVGDVDPRGDRRYCFSISDKARAVAGGVLEGILFLSNKCSE